MGTYSGVVQWILFGNNHLQLEGYGQATHMGVFLVPTASTNAAGGGAFNTSVAWYEREILFPGNNLNTYLLFSTPNPFANNIAIAPGHIMTNRRFIDIPLVPTNNQAPVIVVTPPP